MNIHEFVQGSLSAIKSAIDNANQISATYKAHYPENIEFDIGITENGDVAAGNQPAATRMKFTLHVSHYPWEKK